ncbi:DUF541 domain-containing protein [Hymenobacter gummosus]|uniref:DUF541 domain-containing protein n=1 Tax=Hymenobacter gummosus TaxID=1776032 RepID=A0A431U5P3_9BACT|nr:SIMPL domain-containing protein [Hymenobacter gummosus]RTQ50938.1 DUF541 domain-containing protein [Hymenobacter gummosus]
MRLLLCLGGLLALSSCAPQTTTTAPVRQIKVSGYGTVTAYPDLAEITVEVSFTKPRLKDATVETQAVVEQVIAASRPFINKPEDLRVSHVSTNKEYDYVREKQVFVGFEATQSLTVQLADLNRLEAYMEALLQTRISRIKSLTYDHSRADSLRREAHMIALRNALKSADKLCGVLGTKRGAVLEVTEGYGSSGDNDGWGRPRPVDMELYGKGMGGRSFRITPELMHFGGVVQAAVALE